MNKEADQYEILVGCLSLQLSLSICIPSMSFVSTTAQPTCAFREHRYRESSDQAPRRLISNKPVPPTYNRVRLAAELSLVEELKYLHFKTYIPKQITLSAYFLRLQ